MSVVVEDGGKFVASMASVAASFSLSVVGFSIVLVVEDNSITVFVVVVVCDALVGVSVSLVGCSMISVAVDTDEDDDDVLLVNVLLADVLLAVSVLLLVTIAVLRIVSLLLSIPLAGAAGDVGLVKPLAIFCTLVTGTSSGQP